MLALTSQETAAVESSDMVAHVRVLIDRDGTSNMADLTNVEGRDWLESVDWRDDVDAAGASAAIVLRREEYNLSLATLVEDSKLNRSGASYVPFLTVGRAVRIEVAVLPDGVVPQSTDWRNRFEGEIDDIDWGGDGPQIRLTCRDKSGYLIDRWIENATNYGTADTQPVETVIQNILTDWAPGVTLYTPVSPSWNILPYQQVKEPVMDAIRKLAQQIGWDVKYRWDAGTSSWRLTLFVVDRAKVTTDYFFGVNQIVRTQTVKLTRVNIRNVVKIVYTDGTTAERTTVVRTDATSITKYGRRFMEVAEDAASQIDSQTEAETFGDALLADLKEPEIDKSVDPIFWPFVETGDRYGFVANGKHFDQNQELSVVSWAHRYNRDGVNTSLQVRGQPSGGFLRWLRLEARPGINAGTDESVPTTPAGVTVVSAFGGLLVTYDMPTDPDWSYSECHVSLDAGFTPSPATKMLDGRTNRFQIGGLVGGATYYVKVVAVDIRGNRSVASSQVAQAVQLSGPGSDNLDTMPGNEIPNGDFNVWSYPRTPDTMPPDKWDVFEIDGGGNVSKNNARWNNGTGTDPVSIWYDNTKSQQGSISLKVNKQWSGFAQPSFMGVRQSDPFPVAPSQLYQFCFASMKSNESMDQFLGFRFYERDKVTTAGSFFIVGVTPADGHEWYRSQNVYQTSPDAAFCVADCFVDNTGAMGTIWWDRIEMRRTLPSFSAYNSAYNNPCAAGSFQTHSFDTELYDHGGNFNPLPAVVGDPTFVVPFDGDYQFAAALSLVGLLSTETMVAGMLVNDVTVQEGTTANGAAAGFGYTTSQVYVGSIDLNEGDVVKMKSFHTGASRNEQLGQTLQWWTGSCLRMA